MILNAYCIKGDYVRNFQNALHTLTRLQEESSKFAQFLTERMQRNYGDPGLLSLISCPLNQISQYSILLEVDFMPFSTCILNFYSLETCSCNPYNAE